MTSKMAIQNVNFRAYAHKSKALEKPMGNMSDNFASGTSAVYIDQLHE